MHSKQPHPFHSVCRAVSRQSIAVVLCSLASGKAMAQYQVAPTSSTVGTAAASVTSASSAPESLPLPAPLPPASFGTSQLAGTPSESNDLSSFTPIDLLHWGPVTLHPYLRYRFSYAEGLTSQPGQSSPTYINELSPSLLLTIKDHWSLDWMPTMRFYSSKNYKDTTDQSVILNGHGEHQDWRFGLTQTYLSSSQPLVEAGAQVDQETFGTLLSANYLMSSKMSLDLSLVQNLRFVDQPPGQSIYQNSLEWSTMDWLNYQFWKKFGVAIGAGAGYVETGKSTSDMTFELLQARINWTVAYKLKLVVNGGGNYRQFLNSESSASNELSPIYGVGLTYALFPQTTLTLNANRSVSASYFQDQITDNTIIQAELSQRLIKMLTLDITGGYRISRYTSTLQGAPLDREDDTPFINIRLSTSFLKRGTASIFYYWSDNTSTQAVYDQSTKQVGIELMYRF